MYLTRSEKNVYQPFGRSWGEPACHDAINRAQQSSDDSEVLHKHSPTITKDHLDLANKDKRDLIYLQGEILSTQKVAGKWFNTPGLAFYNHNFDTKSIESDEQILDIYSSGIIDNKLIQVGTNIYKFTYDGSSETSYSKCRNNGKESVNSVKVFAVDDKNASRKINTIEKLFETKTDGYSKNIGKGAKSIVGKNYEYSKKVYGIYLGVDGDGNKNIDFADIDDKVLFFWLNNDTDGKDANSDLFWAPDTNPYWEEDDGVIPTPNSWDNTIGASEEPDKNYCKRDLEDFTLLSIKVDKELEEAGVQYFLKIQTNRGVTQGINLFNAIDNSFDYLDNAKVSDRQVVETLQYSLNPPWGQPTPEIQLNSSSITFDETMSFLMEGSSFNKGRAVLYLYAKKHGVIIGRDHIVLDFRNISEFLDAYYLDLSGESFLNNDYVRMNAVPRNKHTVPSKTGDYVLFVHGFNVSYFDASVFAETMYKRLWWQGYRGNMGFFKWPSAAPAPDSALRYNEDEFRAWHSARALKRLMIKLNSHHPNAVRVLGHSMGNYIVSEALKQLAEDSTVTEQVVHTYISSQSSVPAQAYDQGFEDAPDLGPWSTPNLYRYFNLGEVNSQCYFNGFTGRVGRVYNYFNILDWALNNPWKANSLHCRPEINYSHFSGTEYRYDDVSFYIPNKKYTVFSRIVQMRSYPVGMTILEINGFFSERRFSLGSLGLNYDHEHYSHSRQFRSNIVDEFLYWQRLRVDFALTIIEEE